MKNPQVLKLYDLIQEVSRLDELIRQHQDVASDTFMIDQYVARKDKIFAKLLLELASPRLASALSYQLVQRLVNRFYASGPVSKPATDVEPDLLELQHLTL